MDFIDFRINISYYVLFGQHPIETDNASIKKRICKILCFIFRKNLQL